MLMGFELNLSDSKTHDVHDQMTESASSGSSRDRRQEQALVFLCLSHCLSIGSGLFSIPIIHHSVT